MAVPIDRMSTLYNTQLTDCLLRLYIRVINNSGDNYQYIRRVHET
jgi:hypothetical protein